MRIPRGRRLGLFASLREELPFFTTACAMGCAMETTYNRSWHWLNLRKPLLEAR